MHFPIIQQHDANDCGPACLAMVSAFYGRRQSIADLRERARTDRQGTNLAGLVRAATEIGFRPRAVRASASAFSHVELPVIAHWCENGRNHFVVVYRHGKKNVILGDPALGRRKLDRSTFNTHWTGTLLLLAPGPVLTSLRQAPLTTIWGLVRFHRKLFLDALIAGLVMTVLALSSAFFIQVLVDLVIPSGRSVTLNWLGAGMLLVLAMKAAMFAFRGHLLAHLGQRIDAEVLLAYHHHVLGLPLSFFSTRKTGEIVARLHDAVRIRTVLGSTGLSMIIDSATLLVTLSVMLWLDWKLALLSVSLMPALALVVAAMAPGLKRAQQQAMERSAQFQAHTVEAVNSIETLRAARAEDRMRLRGEARLAEVLEATFRSDVYSLWSATSASLFAGVSALSLLWAGGHAVLAARITTGQLMALYTLFGTIIGPVERLAGANQSIQDALVAGERLGDVLALPDETATDRESATDRPIEGSVEFRRIRFRYANRPALFNEFSLKIPKGECFRISGASGSGKSTLVRLLVRFYEPETGCVLIDGIDVREYSLESLRRQVVVVSQESSVLSASIGDNIRLGSKGATPDQVRSAALRAGVHDFAQAAPHGYDTLVGERGVALSGGERQRLILARAILHDPAILVLDEPTNHLDPPSVQAVAALIECRREKYRTTILISHDPLHADRTASIDGQSSR